MPEIPINIEVFCTCGAGICNNTSVGKTKSRRQDYFEVSPCGKCLEEAKEEGRKDGYNEGYEDARKEFEKVQNA